MTKTEEILSRFDQSLDAMLSYGYKLVTWHEFLTNADVPNGLLDRALKLTDVDQERRQYVVYDPEDDDEGWMLIGERDEIVRESVKDLIDMNPPEGPLSKEELGE